MGDWRGNQHGNGAQLLNVKAEVRTADPAGLGAGDAGRFWYRSDTTPKVLKFWDGTTAHAFRVTDDLIVSADIADGTIVAADLAAALKPSGTAVDATEALRALGFTAGKAMPGTAKLNEVAVPTATLDLNGQEVMNAADPTTAQSLATRSYVDAVATGLDVKKSVKVATTAAGTLATAFENGDTIDGYVLQTGDRILIKDQAAPAENGIYTVNGSGAPTRATDADSNTEMTPGMFTFVERGTLNADTGWVLTTDTNPIIIGTTSLTFVQFSSAGLVVGGAGLVKTGNTLDVVAADGSIVVGADSITVGNVPVAKGGTGATTAAGARTNIGALTAAEVSIGNGAASTFTITQATHGMSVISIHSIQVYDRSVTAEPLVDVDVTVDRTSGDIVISGFTTVPTNNQYRVMIVGAT